MLARNETIIKWILYAAAAVVCFFLQTAVLQRVTIWGIIPFLYPALAAVPATYEGPVFGSVFALGVGVVCDLILPGSVPCFYTLLFPPVGVCAGLLSRSLLPAGVLCSAATTAIAVVVTDLAHGLVLWFAGKAAWSAAFYLLVRELCLALPLALLITPLFAAVYRKTHLFD